MRSVGLHTVPVLERSSLQRFAAEYAHVFPVVLRGAAAIDRLRLWEPAALISRAGGVPVAVNFRHEHFDFDVWRIEHRRHRSRAAAMMSMQQMPLGDALDEMFGLAAQSLPRDIAVAGADCRLLAKPDLSEKLCPLAEDLGCGRPHLWAAGSRRRHQAHFDPGDVFIIMVHGKKRFALAPPSATSGLYPYPDYAALSQIPDLLDVDAGRWPLFEPDSVWMTELNPQEVLYIPQHWWHQSDYLLPSLSLSMWPN